MNPHPLRRTLHRCNPADRGIRTRGRKFDGRSPTFHQQGEGMTTTASLEMTVSARALSRSFGGNRAVRDVSVQLRRGEVLGLLGPNGAGKTTTMQMLTGNLAPTNGEVDICGIDLIGQPSGQAQVFVDLEFPV